MATPTATGQLPAKYRGAKRDPLLDKCRDYYKISMEKYEDCIREGQEIIDMYHNRHYTQAQLLKLRGQGQPAETFNLVKMFTNAIVGYLDTVVNKLTIEPRYPSSSATASLINDVVQVTLDNNDWGSIEKFMKIDGLLTGLMVAYEEVVPTGNNDEFGRMIYDIKLEHIPSWQVRIDPMSHREDYSDARFIHHFKWMPEETVKRLFPNKWQQLVEYYNYLEDDQSEYDREYLDRDIGKFKEYNNYLITKTIVHHKGKVYSVIWNDEIILEKKVITYKEVKFPYRIMKLSKSDKSEYYGPYRDIVETQKAVNQALLQIQQLINTSKAFVEEGSVDNIEEFRELFNRVNAVIPVTNLQGIKVEDMSRDIAAQYSIIDQALQRIKMVLGINDSFLGQAYASDSGRKVRLQQMASSSQLTNIVDRVGSFYKLVGEDITKLIRQYYRGHQILKVADPLNSYHYAEINPPLTVPVGVDPATGQPIMQPVIVPDMHPETGEVLRDSKGNIVMIPLNDPNADIEFADVDIRVISSRGDNSDERNQLLFETFTNGPMGQMLMQFNPAGTLRILAMQISEYGTKHSIEIAKILMETAMMVDQGQIDPMEALNAVGPDIQKIMGGALGGSTGNIQNMPRSGQQAGNTGGIPQVNNVGGRP